MIFWLPLWTACRSEAPDAPIVALETARPDRLRLVALGDVGEGNAAQSAVAEAVAAVCAERGCDAVLLLGDNIYPKGVTSPDDPALQERFEVPYAGLDLPFLVVLGNHDYGEFPPDDDRAAAQVAYSQVSDKWTMPAPYYQVQAGPAVLFALDTNKAMFKRADDQRAWLESGLSASQAPLRVAFGHHPWVSNGRHGSAGAYEGSRALPYASGGGVLELLEPLCGQVDVYLSGHDHNRQWLEPGCGVELIVSGAGAKVRGLEDRGHPTLFEDDERPGFLWLELSPGRLEGAFYDQDGALDFERTIPLPAR